MLSDSRALCSLTKQAGRLGLASCPDSGLLISRESEKAGLTDLLLFSRVRYGKRLLRMLAVTESVRRSQGCTYSSQRSNASARIIYHLTSSHNHINLVNELNLM